MTELAASIREFLSTPSARRATALYVDQSLLSEISIHALREEGDERICVHSSESGNFYPRPPRGGRRHDRQLPPHHQEISIHALREEGDTSNRDTLTWVAYFYPRPPRGGRRDPAAVEEVTPYFYPRPPRGGRQVLAWRGDPSEACLSTPSARRATTNLAAYHLEQIEFLSTPSARRATPDRLGVVQGQPISIHALREEGDAGSRPHRSHQGLFLSTPSARRATDAELDEMAWELFLSTPSARRATG